MKNKNTYYCDLPKCKAKLTLMLQLTHKAEIHKLAYNIMHVSFSFLALAATKVSALHFGKYTMGGLAVFKFGKGLPNHNVQ